MFAEQFFFYPLEFFCNAPMLQQKTGDLYYAGRISGTFAGS